MHVLRTEENRAEQQPYERIMVYFSAVTAQWIRVWPQRFCDGLRKCSPPTAAATPPHWAHCCTQQISSLCYTSGVFWKRTGCLRGWGLRKECVCVCAPVRVCAEAEKTHIHSDAQRIRHRSHHQPTLKDSLLPPSCGFGPSPAILVCFGWSVSLISTHISEERTGLEEGSSVGSPNKPASP